MKYISFFSILFMLCVFNIHSQNIPISTFLYQLQELDLEAVGDTDFDLVVMDYSADGDDETAYEAAQLEALKHSPGGDKIVLSYLSIGEAESYRFYWQSSWKPGNPEWLDEENPDWKENYKVHYWHPEWQAIILSYLDRILNAGFNGVYLDLVDAYETYVSLSSIQASQEMVDFVGTLRNYTRAKDENFLIFVQNAEELEAIHPNYLNVVDGIGREDLYYGYEGDGDLTPADVTAAMQIHLDVFLNAGKTVLTIDYPFGNSEVKPHFDGATLVKIQDAYAKSRARGYIPYCTVRELNYLTLNPISDPTKVTIFDQHIPFQLYPNYPNPFNSSTLIPCHLATGGWVTVKVYDALGREVGVMLNGYLSAGHHRIKWDASGFATGMYFYQIETTGSIETGRMVLAQ